jgi:diguanylate cyclase (GGDEF)-like protein
MSFRTRLTSFFVLIVVVPMAAFGVLVYRLISDSEQGKADARANGLATAAASVYGSASATARAEAGTIARDAGSGTSTAALRQLSLRAARRGLARMTITSGGRRLTGFGAPSAIAPGLATLDRGSRPRIIVMVSALTASAYERALSGPGVAVVVRQGGRALSSTLPVASGRSFPARGTVKLGDATYRAVTQSFPGFDGSTVEVTVLSNLSATASSVGASRLIAAIFIGGFLLLAAFFSILASRALQGQLGRFLQAARRLGSGDFSSPIETEGQDEFAALGAEFNNMSRQLARRLDELSEERARLRESIRRIGHTFASNLDRPALLELALKTAVDAVQATCGRVSIRHGSGDPLIESVRVGSLAGFEDQVGEAERLALTAAGAGEVASAGISTASIALGPLEAGDHAHGLITVGRRGAPFAEDDRALLRSLAAQATLALENIELHYQVRRQAVTDELTGLANHGHFHDLLSAEIERQRRHHDPVGLIMLDIDNFKSVNDTYGHQQGDVVLEHVARALRETSREGDVAARYGGDEMALILPHTDLEESYAIAEHLRTKIEDLRIPRTGDQGTIRITVSLGVAATYTASKDLLVSYADGALYSAKGEGKHRTATAPPQTANLIGGE